MRVILSIRPKHVRKIISGKKRYEFRKVIFKDRSVHEIYVYSSSPVKKIVGKFNVGQILEDHPEALWEKVKDDSGLTKSDFYSYFSGKNKGYAIEIVNFVLFEEPIDPKKIDPKFIPPQSFIYLKD
ncbi:hypothetical protein RJ40_02045 [Methanofollis aquaemaris]|uniref:ASCH domain-containing protein n=1 Tax=Methanofollis aquaemaris TaxID=126734 RepID=A0A8A3S425_9EURY|nr:hypothetical protein [Methanofollis aquaemaris]QSZ66364.1 hypothetical protein RJ40_02045 [Methanofollis aquaemaris]